MTLTAEAVMEHVTTRVVLDRWDAMAESALVPQRAEATHEVDAKVRFALGVIGLREASVQSQVAARLGRFFPAFIAPVFTNVAMVPAAPKQKRS